MLCFVFARLTNVPLGFAPFTPAPIVAGSVAGPFVSTVGYPLLWAFVRDQRALNLVFVAAGIALLGASYYLPWRLTYSASPRFAGVTIAAQFALGLLHTIVVGVSVVSFLRRYMPHDLLPPWEAVYQQTRRWLRAGVFEEMVHDLRVLLRLSEGRAPEPTAAILDSRTLRSTPESGARAGYDGAKRKKGSKVHAAVDTLGHLLALRVGPADEQDRERVGELAGAVQEATGESVELAYVDQGYTGERPATQAGGSRHEVGGG